MKLWITAAWIGARLALRRLGGRSTLLITLGAVVFATLAGWAERHANALTAAELALRGPAFGLAIPLASLAFVTVALARTRLDEAVGSVALIGGNRRAAAFGALGGTAVITAFVGLVTAALTTIVAYGDVTGAAVGDAWTAAWIGGLTGGVYAFYFGLSSGFGKRGGGRIVALLADLILGPLVGTAAVLFPRAHALNLLGADPVLALPQAASFAILVGMAGVFALSAALRTRP
ncbi:MAG: hypothetical protein ACOC1F_00500 [Myxococcota bacterium]